MTKSPFEIQSEIEACNILSLGREAGRIVMIVPGNDSQREKMILEVKHSSDDCYMELRKVYNHYQRNYEVGVQGRTPTK